MGQGHLGERQIIMVRAKVYSFLANSLKQTGRRQARPAMANRARPSKASKGDLLSQRIKPSETRAKNSFREVTVAGF
jgi:hypothetical protein